MPNWCENHVYLEASPEEIAAIAALIKSENNAASLLNHLRPEPEYPESAGNEIPSWYSWRVANWGTKWDVQAEIVSHSIEGGWMNLWFDSAWSPPIAALDYWAEQDSTRRFNIRYIEWGMAFCGEADETGLDEHYAIPGTVAEVHEKIPEELDEQFSISYNVAEWEAENEEVEA